MSSIPFNSSFINDFDIFDAEALCLYPQKLPNLVQQQIVVKLAVSYHDAMHYHVGLLNVRIYIMHIGYIVMLMSCSKCNVKS